MAVVADMVDGLNSPKFRLIRIELLVLLGVIGLFVLLVLGSYRRRSSREAIKLTIWVVYAASIPMVSYTLGLMQSSPYKNSLFSVWAVILFIFLGSADSFSAYSLQDNDDWKKFYLEQLIQSFWVGWLMGSSGGTDFWQPMLAIYIIVILKSGTRVASFKLASARFMLSDSTKWVADYMSYEHLDASNLVVRWDPINMEGYRYVVAGEDKNKPRVEPPDYLLKYNNDDRARLVTVEQIWMCHKSLLRGRDGQRLKDVCLSMALSKMLNRKFAGFQKLVEANLNINKTHQFLFDGLLQGNDPTIYSERALRVIELFQHFLGRTPDEDELINLISASNRNYEALFTFVIVTAIALVEALQVYTYLASAWTKVALISNYVVSDSWSNLGVKLIRCITSLKYFRSWEDKLGQYTLLKDFDYKPINLLYRVTFTLVDKNKKGRKEGKRIRLSTDIKKTVLQTLKLRNGHLTKGTRSLQEHQQLSWSCNLPTTNTHHNGLAHRHYSLRGSTRPRPTL